MTRHATPVLGWDIGGVNTKAARVERHGAVPSALRAARPTPYEIQRDPAALAPTLARAGGEPSGARADGRTRSP